ncbi:glycosyltransferase family 2 protein [Comamonas flocculans]|uniref:Glycosyltransferase n=1 Tax=Comamonas flocculans TaxID=2597701 RepID=A0A5B8RSK7_9BURK|nr:glycosyltransferase family 2 protein [Comamonas flocculans]QEA12480.1 glycosyltransferase [Comamonas flocculans]
MAWLMVFLWAALLLLGVPVLVLALQVGAAWPRRADGLPLQMPDVPVGPTPRIAVLVPAHDEAVVIGQTVRRLRDALTPQDVLCVVADNCGDDTARIAREAGAQVAERFDAQRRGKGYALDHGVRHLSALEWAPDALLIVDADCTVATAGGLHGLARLALAQGRPVQALDLMHAPEGAGLKLRVAAFAWRVKNWVRPLGALAMGWPCQLMGTGMAFPWAMARQMPLASGELVEDMQLGMALALTGTPPLFCPQVLVSSEFPDAASAVQSQRRRWEHGHLGMIVRHVPRLFGQAIARRDGRLLALALDLAVPPLALLVLLLLAVNALALLTALLGGGAAPLVLAMACLALLAAGILAAWWGWGRAVVSARDLLAVPWYVLSKLPLYLGYWFKRQKEWVRTDRE